MDKCENPNRKAHELDLVGSPAEPSSKSSQIITGHASHAAPPDAKLRGDVSEVFDKRCKLDGRWGDEQNFNQKGVENFP